MDNPNGSTCLYQDRPYRDGAEVSGYILRLVCRDGEWHDMDEGAEDSGLSLEYFYH